MARRVLLICGVVSSAFYLAAIDVLAPIVHPGYHGYTSQMVSELLALGAPTRPLLVVPMLLYNLLVFAFAAGVWVSAEGRGARVLTAVALVGYGVSSTVGLLLAPMDLRSAGISNQTLLHIWATAVQGLFIVLVLVFGVFVHTGRFRRYAVATLVTCVVFGALASLEAAQSSMHWIGLTERVNIYAWMVWLAALALSLLPAHGVIATSREDPRRPDRSTSIGAFITRHPLPTYFALAFAISWGGLLTVVGLAGFTGATEATNTQLPFVFLAMFAGPTVAGLLLRGLVDGTAGFRDVRTRLLTWRVGARWYAVAVLAAPLLMIVTLFALSLTNPVFLPGIVISEGKASLALTSIVAGLMTGFFEELGWTGFAVPRLRLRGGVLTTGLGLGVLWGLWHLPLVSSGDSSGVVPPVLFVPGLLFTVLPAFRVLMVWVYDRTGSLLVAMLMHASLTTSTLILQPLAAGVPALTYNLVLAAALWGVVAAVTAANGWHASQRPLPTGTV